MQTVRLNPEQLGETKLPLSELQLVLMIDMGNEKLYKAREGSAGPHRTQRLREGAECVFHTHGVSGLHATRVSPGTHQVCTSGHVAT